MKKKKMDYNYVLENIPSNLILANLSALRFFNREPRAFLLISNNLDKSVLYIGNILFSNGISNKGKPISVTTVYKYVNFVKSVRDFFKDDFNLPFGGLSRSTKVCSPVTIKESLVDISKGGESNYGCDKSFGHVDTPELFSVSRKISAGVLKREYSTISKGGERSTYKLKYYTLNLKMDLNEGLKEFIEILESKKKYIFLFQIKTEDGYWITLSKQIILEVKDGLLDIIKTYLEVYLEIQGEIYDIKDKTVLVIKYYLIDIPYNEIKNDKENFRNDLNDKFISKYGKLNFSSTARILSNLKGEFLNIKYLPSSIDNFGTIISKHENVIRYQYNKNIIIESIRINHEIQKNKIYLNDVMIMKYEDHINVDYSWERNINNLKIYYNKNGHIYKYECIINCKYIEREKICKKHNKNFISMDIETYIDNEEHIPYCIGWYDGKIKKKYHILDYENKEMMIDSVFEDLTNKKYNRYTIYLHNMAKFDSAFLLNNLIKKFKVTPIMKDGKLLSLTLIKKQPEMVSEIGIKKFPRITLYIKDSFLLIPTSLKDAAISFNVLHKGIFPYNFVNKNRLNYIGSTPSYIYYESQISKQNYESIKIENWSCKEESLKYLENDLITLHEILIKFSTSIYELFNLNIINHSTISSLAFKIFLTHYLPKGVNIPILKGIHNKNQSQAYYGGFLEVYEPLLKNGYHYDVNSLYPYQMKNYMPVGSPILTTEKNLDKIFGICYVKITTPSNIDKPILPFRDEMGRIYYPKGSWEGWYVSEELKNAKKYGYTIKVIESYKYKKKYIFNNYVDKISTIKEKSEGAIYLIAKLLSNSLSGRLAINEFNTISEFLDEKRFEDILKTHNIYEYIKLSCDHYLVKYDIEANETLCNIFNIDSQKLNKLSGNPRKSSRSIAIPAFITAYGRIFMSNYLKDSVYIDTDGISTKKEIDKDQIDKKKIGKFKLENEILLGYFLAPKLYYHFTLNGTNICKAAGLGELLTRNDYRKIYKGGLITKNKEKWKYNIEKGTINLLSSTITLSLNSYKRLNIIIDGVWIGTSPREVYKNKISPLSLIIRPSYPIQKYIPT